MAELTAKLRVLNGELANREFELDHDAIVIGRQDDCDVILPDAGISRRHARIDRRDDSFVLSDLGSYNGVVLDGQRVEWINLRPGLKFRLGGIDLEFLAEEDERATPIEAGAVAAGLPAIAREELPAARPMSMKDLFQGSGVPPEEERSPEEIEAARNRREAILYALGICGLIFAGLLLHGHVERMGQGPPRMTMILRQGDNLLADPWEMDVIYFDECYPFDGEIVTAEIDSLVRAVRLEAAEVGDEDIKLLRRGRVVGVITVIVKDRPRRPPPKEREWRHVKPDPLRRMAERKMREAGNLTEEALYRKRTLYHEAYRMFGLLEDRSTTIEDLRAQARDQRGRTDRAIRKKFESLGEEYETARKIRNYPSALHYAQLAYKLIPNEPGVPRNLVEMRQRAAVMVSRMLRYLRRRAARRRKAT